METFASQMMKRALELAERGRGSVEPNPLVGAVIVRDGQVVGEGWHERYGADHAELNVLAKAGESAWGSTLYVTLEPCCHHGKTPPCTDAIIRAGVRRVVASMLDPFPQVSGKGAEQLRAAGIDVEIGVAEAEARELNAPYLKLLKTGRPYVIAKWAMSLDGKIATKTGDSKWISGEASRRRVHELRGRMDAIIVGVGTILADDPLLTARPPGPRTPVRIVLDRRLRTPVSSRLVQSSKEAKVLLAHGAGADANIRHDFETAGCECFTAMEEEGEVSIAALLDELGRRRMTNVLVEGGSQTLGSFLDAGEIDEVYAFVAPKLIGSSKAPSPLAGEGIARVTDAVPLRYLTVEQIDGDWLFHGRSQRG